MPRSRSRKKRSSRDTRSARVPDSLVLLELLEMSGTGDEDGAADPLLFDMFDRAAWSFHAGPDPWYTEQGSLSRDFARLRAREWFLLEFELPSGLTPAEEWILEREGEPGSAGRRRSVERFVNSECGVFDVEDIRADGLLRLVPSLGGDPVLARPIDRGAEMLRVFQSDLPQFGKGDTIVTRLYWLDDERAELSAGTDRIGAEAKAALLADPPNAKALRSALVLEALFGADAGRLLSVAGDVRFPRLVDELLAVLSDGTFRYRHLWRELEGEPDPVAVARQLLSELDQWTVVEQELLACGVAGAWLRRMEAAAGRTMTPATLERQRRDIEEHVRTILDVPGEPELRLAPDVPRLAMSLEDADEIAKLSTDPVEWVVDLRPDDGLGFDRISLSSSPYPRVCAVVEQDIDPFDALAQDEGEMAGKSAGGDEEDEELPVEVSQPGGRDEGLEEDLTEDDLDDLEEKALDDADGLGEEGTGDEAVPELIQKAPVREGEDEALVALTALVEGLLAGEEPLPRPRRIVFRQRRVAALLDETLRDAGLEVALRYLTGVVDAALDEGPDALEEDEDLEAQQAATGESDAVQALSDEERTLHQRLLDAARRSRNGLESLALETQEFDTAPVIITPAQPLEFPFATLEGEETRVLAFAVVTRPAVKGLTLDVFFVSPTAAAPLDFRGRDGQALLDPTDLVMMEIGDLEDIDPGHLDDMKAAGWPCGKEGSCVIAVRQRPDAAAAFLRGRELAVMAGVMEAVAALAEHADNGPGWEESLAVDVRVEPLGDVKAEWRAPWPPAE